MRIFNRLILVILNTFLFISCNDVNKSKEIYKSRIIENDTTYQKETYIYFLKNKKEVNKIYKDSIYTGVIAFNSLLDTVTTELYEFEKYPNRGILFYKTQNHKREISLLDKQLNGKVSSHDLLKDFKSKNKLDTLYAISSDKIPIFGLKFNEVGTHYINGIVEDFVHIKTSDTSKVRLISKDIIISTSFEVIEPDL
ncbi:hypothetical protein [Aurantibacter aestuarii]|nr:hypothetical protein [Aurantibacter aestuarii]